MLRPVPPKIISHATRGTCSTLWETLLALIITWKETAFTNYYFYFSNMGGMRKTLLL